MNQYKVIKDLLKNLIKTRIKFNISSNLRNQFKIAKYSLMKNKALLNFQIIHSKDK